MGEANTKYFQAKATIKFRHNNIVMLKDEDGNEHFEHQAKATILYRAFKDRMGTSSATQNPLLLQHLLLPQEYMSALEAPFLLQHLLLPQCHQEYAY